MFLHTKTPNQRRDGNITDITHTLQSAMNYITDCNLFLLWTVVIKLWWGTSGLLLDDERRHRQKICLFSWPLFAGLLNLRRARWWHLLGIRRRLRSMMFAGISRRGCFDGGRGLTDIGRRVSSMMLMLMAFVWVGRRWRRLAMMMLTAAAVFFLSLTRLFDLTVSRCLVSGQLVWTLTVTRFHISGRPMWTTVWMMSVTLRLPAVVVMMTFSRPWPVLRWVRLVMMRRRMLGDRRRGMMRFWRLHDNRQHKSLDYAAIQHISLRK